MFDANAGFEHIEHKGGRHLSIPFATFRHSEKKKKKKDSPWIAMMKPQLTTVA